MTDWYKKKDIIKSIILNKLGKTKNKIYARKAVIKEVDIATYNKFLSANHLQGQAVSKIRLGLYYNDELVQVMGFSSLRKATGRTGISDNYELIRMCSKLHNVVVGGSDKLLKYFIKKYKPTNILSYANRDWATGNVYENMGFNFVKYTSPGYFYVKSKTKYHRYKFQKHLLVRDGYDPNKTEYEIMLDCGFYRVWDTGNMIYEYQLN